MSALPQYRETARLPFVKHAPEKPSARHLRAVPPLPATDDRIPDPPPRFVQNLAAQAYEAVEGIRSIAQLGSNITVGVARQLSAQRAVLSERRQVYRDSRSSAPSLGGLRIFRVHSKAAEAAVVLHTEHRTRAVALRLEWVHGRWRACELFVL